MSSFLSRINPTTKSVQREYVEKRKRALFANDPAKTERVRKKIEAVMAKNGASTQASLNTIGALTEHLSMSMMDLIWRSCYQNLLLPDTDSGDELVEAHIFRKLKVAEDVQMMVLSRQRKSSEEPWSNAEWTHIVGNARKWCQRNSVRLVFASP